MNASPRPARSAEDLIAAFGRLVLEGPDFAVVLDSEGRYVYASPNWGALAGWTADDFLGRRYDEFIVTEDLPVARRSFEALVKGAPWAGAETRFRKKGQGFVLLSWRAWYDPKEELMYCLARDATDVRDVEDELRRNLAYANALLRASPDLLFVMDGDFAIRDWFAHDERDLMMRPEEFLNRRMTDILPAAVSAEFQETVARAKASGRAESIEYRVETFGGEKDFEGRVVAHVHNQILLVVRDITEKKSLEFKAFAASKMAALGEMAAALAHEINNPLTVLFAATEELAGAVRSENANLSRAAEACERIARTAGRIAKTVRALRSFARDGRMDPFEERSARSLVEDAFDLCASQFRNQGLDLSIAEGEGRVDPSEVIVECRPVQISQILLNLLGNAFDAVNPIADPKRRWVRIEIADLGDAAEICVVDGGDGPPANAVARMMLPFFTTKPPGRGTGLGLSISRGLAEEHGGSIRYDRSGGETRFHLRLPKKQPPTAPKAP